MKALKKIDLSDVLFIDIETSSVVPELIEGTPLYDSFLYSNGKNVTDLSELPKLFKQKAALSPDFGRIVCISIGRLFKGKFVTTSFNDFDEKELILKFNDSLNKENWLLAGHAVKTFDIPFIFKRSIVNGIVPHPLVDTSGEKPWTMDWIIDTKDLWQGSGMERSSLVNITTILGLPSPKNDITGAEVPEYFWKDPEGNIDRISKYCERDVVAVYDVLNAFKNIGNIEGMKEVKTLVNRIFDGNNFSHEDEENIIDLIKTLNDTEKDQMFVILQAMISTAAGKKTKFTKDHLKNIINKSR